MQLVPLDPKLGVNSPRGIAYLPVSGTLYICNDLPSRPGVRLTASSRGSATILGCVSLMTSPWGCALPLFVARDACKGPIRREIESSTVWCAAS